MTAAGKAESVGVGSRRRWSRCRYGVPVSGARVIGRLTIHPDADLGLAGVDRDRRGLARPVDTHRVSGQELAGDPDRPPAVTGDLSQCGPRVERGERGPGGASLAPGSTGFRDPAAGLPPSPRVVTT